MDGDTRLRVTLLGDFQASRGDVALPVRGARLQGLFVRLALAGGRTVEPGVLVDAIWAEDPPAGPAHALQALVSRLRRALGAAGDVTQAAGGYRLEAAAADVDALRFEQLAAAGRERLRAGDPHAAAAALGEAVALWGDRPGAEPPAVAAVAPAAAARLAHASAEAVADLADAELALGQADTAAARLTALLAEHPVHERAAALLMDALAAQGRQAEALAQYERFRETLADTLGTDPGTALRERHLSLLRGERPVPPLAAGTEQRAWAAGGARPAQPAQPARPARSAPTAGGTRPVPTADTALSAVPPSTGPSNLPAPLTSFVGRDDDLARIGTLLAAGRLVTVLGPGGAGKTRLAVEAARRLRHEYRDGAWMIDLASVTEPAKVGAAVLAGIGMRGGARFEARTRTEGDELDILADQLGGREILLLVDNCEHLIDAVARLVAALLSRCSGLRALATSREPLAVDGEALVPLGPLALPGPDDGVEEVRRAAAVRLFTERAAAVRPGFETDGTTLDDVRRVVRGLDGMPLALELAAARLRTLSLPELADGLSDRFRLLTTGSRTALPRHRTLRAVIAWSWDLLSAYERTVAERVAVLPGGVTPASAAAVCAGTAVPPAEIPELLAALVDRSLLHLAPEPGRYRMLETLREYGADRLAATGALGTVRDLAAGYFAELVAGYEPQLRGPGQPAAMRVIGAEYDNTLAALRRRCDTGDASGAVALALNLAWYWQMLDRHSDAAYWLGEALAVPGGETPGGELSSRELPGAELSGVGLPGAELSLSGRVRSSDRDCARAIHLLNRLSHWSGRPPEETAADEAEIEELAGRLLGDPELPGPYGVLIALPFTFLRGEKTVPAIIERLAGGDDVWLSGLARMYRARFAENVGELERTRTDVEAALACFREVGDRWGQANALPMRAQLRQYDDDLDGALADLRRARALEREFGSLSLNDEVFGDMRWIDLYLRRGETDLVIATIDSARERALRAALPGMLFLVDAWEARLRVRLGDLDRARELLDAAELGLRDAPPFPGGHVLVLIGTGKTALCLELGDPVGAERSLAKAYAAALETGDLPITSLVAVNAAALAGAYGRHRESAVLLGAASRLRGAHDRTDHQVRDLTRRGRAALGEGAFDAAYGEGWGLDGKAAVRAADPARLRAPSAGSRS
ncbi:BTAD domain-containing putative transcriptional regulator [Streptomyces sp. NPDC050617]|uniref:AfsR/SARP family transcriptional regulator n=1 Tax=Streptomyces sp. NPDC050617 TaxID=3154628 RepID=UPI0034260B1D